MLKGTIKESSELLFVEHLKKHGYPDSAIVTEWRIQKACIDIVVFDTETNIPLMIVECKSVNNPHSLEAAVNQLRRYNDVMDYPVRTYAAIYTGSSSFDFYDFTEKIKDASTPISQCGPINIPAYETIKTGAKSKFIDSQKKKKRKYITGLRIACWGVIPLIIALIIFLDVKAYYPLTTERLILYSVLFLSLLLPFFGEIKIGDFFTLSHKKKDEDE